MARDVIIYDAEYERATGDISEYARELYGMMVQYITAMQKITQDAVKSQRLMERLARLTEQMQSLCEPMEDISEAACKLCQQYIRAVDSADQFLY